MWAYHCIRLKGAGEEVLLKLELSVVKCRWKAERLWVADVLYMPQQGNVLNILGL